MTAPSTRTPGANITGAGGTAAPAQHPRHPAPSLGRSVWLVATREILARLRSKAFLISTGILLLVSIGSVVAGGIASQNQTLPKVAVVGSGAAQVVRQVGTLTAVEADDVAAAEALVRAGTVTAAIVPTETPAGQTQTQTQAPTGYPVPLRVIALSVTPLDVVGVLSLSPEVTLLEPSKQGEGLVYLVAIGFGLVFFMSAITFGSTIAQSVVEEKQTRVVEILMTTIPVRALLAGKVVGNSIMAFAQIVAIGLLVSIGMAVTGQHTLLGDIGPSLVWFAVFFAFGFVMLASLFAATASMVSRQEDVGSATSPVLVLVMIPYFLVIFFNDNPTVLAIMSYIPFSAPVGMPMRIFLGTAAWWEPLLSLAILLASTALVILFGSRIYANSLLRMGARVTFREALRG